MIESLLVRLSWGKIASGLVHGRKGVLLGMVDGRDGMSLGLGNGWEGKLYDKEGERDGTSLVMGRDVLGQQGTVSGHLSRTCDVPGTRLDEENHRRVWQVLLTVRRPVKPSF